MSDDIHKKDLVTYILFQNPSSDNYITATAEYRLLDGKLLYVVITKELGKRKVVEEFSSLETANLRMTAIQNSAWLLNYKPVSIICNNVNLVNSPEPVKLETEQCEVVYMQFSKTLNDNTVYKEVFVTTTDKPNPELFNVFVQDNFRLTLLESNLTYNGLSKVINEFTKNAYSKGYTLEKKYYSYPKDKKYYVYSPKDQYFETFSIDIKPKHMAALRSQYIVLDTKAFLEVLDKLGFTIELSTPVHLF